MKVLILSPRLDTTFKKGPVPSKISTNIPEIRVHWRTFLNNLKEYHISMGDDVIVIEQALWQFTPSCVLDESPDVAYIPHKDINRFKCPGVLCLYYMQMVFPWLFEVDSQGPFSLSTNFPQPIYEDVDTNLIQTLRERSDKGISKFDQPKSDIVEQDFILFAGQIAHDESIQLHSSVSVAEAAKITSNYCKKHKLPLIIKPHPFDRRNDLQVIASQYGTISNDNIIDLLKKCRALVTVNSGCGMEALLYDKPVFYFGRAEYSPVAIKAEKHLPIERMNDYIHNYKKFLTSYFNDRIDSRSLQDYEYLEKFFVRD
jgi:hypothetical protein